MVSSNMPSSLKAYLKRISRHRILKPQEEIELSKRFREGDQEAFDELVNCNLRFVVDVALDYRSKGVPLSDLIAEGNKGLIKAASKFDASKNIRFISYAVWWVRHAMLKAMASQCNLVRIPYSKIGDFGKVSRAIESFEKKNHRPPSDEETALESGLDLNEVRKIMQVMEPHASLDKDTEGSLRLVDKVTDTSDKDDLEKVSLRDAVSKAMKCLNDKEKRVVDRYFGIDGGVPMTLESIGNCMGLTRQRIRQILRRAMQKMKPYYIVLKKHLGGSEPWVS